MFTHELSYFKICDVNLNVIIHHSIFNATNKKIICNLFHENFYIWQGKDFDPSIELRLV